MIREGYVQKVRNGEKVSERSVEPVRVRVRVRSAVQCSAVCVHAPEGKRVLQHGPGER